MSFRCESCSEVNTKPFLTTTKVRVINHRVSYMNRRTGEEMEAVTGRGNQIVEAKTLCSTCASTVAVETVSVEAPVEIEKIEEEEDYTVGYGGTPGEDYED